MDQFNRMLARYEPIVLSIFRIMVGLLLFSIRRGEDFQISGAAVFCRPPAADRGCRLA